MSTSNQFAPAIAFDDSGNFVIIWQSYGQDKANTYGIFGQRYDSAGNAVGGEFQVNTTTSGDQDEVAVAMDADGDFVVVWAGQGASPADTWGIWAQRYDSAGNAVGG